MDRALHRPLGAPTGTAPAAGRDALAWWLLVLALALGALRFWRLGAWSLWLDEALTLADARHGLGLWNPLGYRLFGHVYDLAGGRPDELWMRLPAAVAGWLVLPLAWWAFRPFVGARAAALATLFLALSSWQLYWSQNARFYTLAQLATLVGGALVLRGLWCATSPWRSLVAGLAGLGCIAAGVALHASVAFFAGALCAAPWLLRLTGRTAPSRAARALWWTLLAAGVAGLVAESDAVARMWGKWELYKGASTPVHLVLTTGFLLTPMIGLAFLFGARRAWVDGSPALRSILAVTLLAVLGAFGVSLFTRVSAQYLFALQPWIALVASVPAAGGTPRARRATGLLLVLVGLPLLLESAAYVALRHGDRPRWREAFELVFAARAPDDLVLAMEAPVGEYYRDPRADDLRRWRAVTWLDTFRSDVHLEWARYPRTIWLVVNLEQLEDWDAGARAEMRAFLGQECELVRELPVPWTPRDLDVLVYRHDP